MLELKGIVKSYRTKDFVQNALNGVSISFRDNEFASILGASGSGKTTMLNIIGGLDQYDEGDLIIEGVSTKQYKSSNWDAYRNNRVGFVFQSYNLIPHQSVLANVELALTLSGVSSKERKQRALKALDEVGLGDHVTKLPSQLSGGQMQRVAIARALINDPEIVLADEPTGALDSKTSDQVMKLLEEIAKDRLVIMVTHNPELAYQYTNRIIELKDGEVINDSNPYKVSNQDIGQQDIKQKAKTKMSPLTALGLSISNLKTKKIRTFITAVAGSIGITGIALILALASGINMYVKNIEQETMSAYPLSVDSSGIDITSFMGGEGIQDTQSSTEAKDDELVVLNTVDSLFTHQNKNDLKSFKEYIDANPKLIEPYVKSIQYKYGISPMLFLENENPRYRQVNPDKIYDDFGLTNMGGMDMIAGVGDMGSSAFRELPGDASLFEEQYDLITGHWPSDKSEAIVVLMGNEKLTDTMLYSMGLKDRKHLADMLESVKNDKEIETETSETLVKFDKLLDVKFKVVNPAEMYKYDDNYKMWVNQSDDVKFMDKAIKEGTNLNVVGVVKVADGTKTPMLSPGIYYTSDLSKDLIQKAKNYDIVQEQIKKPDINVFTGKKFEDMSNLGGDNALNIEELITIDESMIQQAFQFDDSRFNIDFSSLSINTNNLKIPPLELEGLASTISSQVNLPIEDVQQVLINILQEFVKSQTEQGVNSLEEWLTNFTLYIQSEAVQEKLIKDLSKINDDSKVIEQLTTSIQNYFAVYMETTMSTIFEQVQNDLAQNIQTMLSDIPSQLQNSIKINPAMFAQAFQFNMDEDAFINLIQSMGMQGQASQGSNLRKLGYRDLEEPSQINLYPKDFTTKEDVVEFIDTYNESMENQNHEDKVVKYTDFVGAIMSSVTTIINTISYALIAFVGISLIVSSIMIGVITYVSVLERIKEIGILRAIGASKKDIRRVFNAETLIVGFIAGAFGIGVTYLVSTFASIIVYEVFGIPNIAHLEVQAAVVLILISMFLAFISGLIPASTAAKKDPVEALRSE
ncbi:ABC transporter ATP-binding protein/permease [Erysipelothrix urinaevulpis]|uniref:ABC transporter ATP-binding protein/permease n=1 Tax=Erysipelothrix urinaevulpis TaxID=2683717 RepID=UPI00135C254C|nr:ABC transporter ATP-binding protein/permease [Erysipelothrix urinaevulpis]